MPGAALRPWHFVLSDEPGPGGGATPGAGAAGLAVHESGGAVASGRRLDVHLQP